MASLWGFCAAASRFRGSRAVLEGRDRLGGCEIGGVGGRFWGGGGLGRAPLAVLKSDAERGSVTERSGDAALREGKARDGG